MESYRPGAWRAAGEGGWRLERVAASVCLVLMASSTLAKLHSGREGGGANPQEGAKSPVAPICTSEGRCPRFLSVTLKKKVKRRERQLGVGGGGVSR